MMRLTNRAKKVSFRIIGFLLLCFCFHSFGETVYAAPNVNIQKRIMDKAEYQGVRKCYTNGMLKPSIKLEYYDSSDYFLDGNSNNDHHFVPLVSGSQEDGLVGRIINYSQLNYNLADEALSCRELFLGTFRGTGGSSDGLVEGKAPLDGQDTTKLKEFLEGMGYTVTETSQNTCFQPTYTHFRKWKTKNKICQSEDGKLFVEEFDGISSGGRVGFKVNNDENELCLVFLDEGNTERCGEWGGGKLSSNSLSKTLRNICNDSKSGNEQAQTGFSDNESPEPGLCYFAGDIPEYKFSDALGDYGQVPGRSGLEANLQSSIPGAPSNVPGANGLLVSANKAINYLSNGAVGEDLSVSRAEQRILYQEYFTGYYGYEVDCASEHTDSEKIWWYDSASGEVKECYITNTGNGKDDDPVNGIVNGDFVYHSIAGVDALKAELNSQALREFDEDELAELADVASGAREYSGPTDDCRGMGAGRSLGWILCPILELIGDGAEGIYQNMVAPMLEIKSYLFNGQDTAVYGAWSTFRDMANVMFVIVLLVVIFSQVTGIGIDNYGIKRILPKLIVCIVLINMSYLICAILIDLSNILGNGLKLMFDNLGDELSVNNVVINQPAQAYPSGASAGSGFPATAIEGMVGIGLIVGFAKMLGPIWASGIGPMILISLLFAGLGVLISIVFTFFLLGARQSAIVVLVTVSPVIVLFNALPNTKSVYNRFIKMFQVLLLVYPIMGLLVGGGNYVSKLLLLAAPGEFYMALTAMVVGIVPIFFLPSLLKEAITALPRIGQMFSGLGDRARNLSGVAKGASLKSEPVKNMERTHQLNAAKRTIDRLSGKEKLSALEKMQMLSAGSTLKKLENEDKVANIFAARERYKGKSVTELNDDTAKALRNGDVEKAEALLGAMTELHGAKGTAGFLGKFYAGEGRNLDTKELRRSIGAAKEHIISNPAIMKELKEDNKDILSMLTSGGKDGNGEFASLSHFTSQEAQKNKMEHWVTQSTEALDRAANSGVLDHDKAQAILKANNEPSSAFYNRLSDKNKAYLEDRFRLSSAPGSASTAGASRASTPVSTTPSGIILGGSIDAARRAGGYNDSNAGRRNTNSKNMQG